MHLFALLACTNPEMLKGDGIDQLPGAGEEGGGPAGSDPLETTGLPGLELDDNTGMCDATSEEVGGAAGAKSYFSGVYLKAESGWGGREKWILFPTELWNATEGEPCEVVWESQGHEGEPLTCLACSYALHVGAEVNESTTTCPEELWNHEGDREWQESYEVAVVGETALFYFQESGNFVGEGYANEQATSFLSEPSCVWF